MRHQPGDVVRGERVALHQLGGDLGHLGDREFVDRGALLVDVMEALRHGLLGRRHPAAARLLMEELHARAVRTDQHVDDPVLVAGRFDHHRAGAVAEQDAGRAVGVVDDRRHLVGAHHDDLARASGFDELGSDRQGIDEARARRLHVEAADVRMPTMSQTRFAVDGKTMSGVVVAQISRSTSAGAVPVFSRNPFTAPHAMCEVPSPSP